VVNSRLAFLCRQSHCSPSELKRPGRPRKVLEHGEWRARPKDNRVPSLRAGSPVMSEPYSSVAAYPNEDPTASKLTSLITYFKIYIVVTVNYTYQKLSASESASTTCALSRSRLSYFSVSRFDF
jgi:hypothetical protein